MPPYKYTVHEAVLQVFVAVRKTHRETLPSAFKHLAANPFEPGAAIRDRAGRSYQVKRFGEWAVTYWPDHFANQVHIVAVEFLRN